MGKIGSDSNGNRLDLIACDHCKNVFNDKEELYEINCVMFDQSMMIFDPVAVDIQNFENELPSIRRVIRFHKDCLCELAGTGWLI